MVATSITPIRRPSRSRSQSHSPYVLSPAHSRQSSESKLSNFETPSFVKRSANGRHSLGSVSTEYEDSPKSKAKLQADKQMMQEAIEVLPEEQSEAHLEEEKELAELLAGENWSPSEADLFTRIRRRGREPLFMASWQLDFGTYPEMLYAPIGAPSYICALSPEMEFRGAQAIQRLVAVGGQVRDRMETYPNHPIEPLIHNEIKKFISWAEKDAQISTSLLLAMVHNRDRRGTSAALSSRMETRMLSLASSLRARVTDNTAYTQTPAPLTLDGEPVKAPSVIYGIAVFHCVAALSSLNIHGKNEEIKTLVILDWSDRTLDLWNAIAVALLVTTARNDVLDSAETATLEIKELVDEDL